MGRVIGDMTTKGKGGTTTVRSFGVWRCKIWAVEGEATAKEGEIGGHGKQEGMGLEL